MMSKKSNLINNVGYNLFISFILLFSIRGFSQSTPDKDYKFLITTRYRFDEVLANNSELEIRKSGTIKWSFPSYYGTATLNAEIDAFSKNSEVITVNFNFRNNPWGHKGKLVINLYKMQMGFSEPSIDYTATQRTGLYNFEILETDEEILVRKKTEDVEKYQAINEAIARKDFVNAKSNFDKLNFKNEFPNINEFNKLEKDYKLNSDKNQYLEIYGLIDNGDLNNLNLKIKNLNFPFEFDKFDKYESLVLDSINKNLDIYNFEHATKLYDYLIKQESRVSQKETIQKKLILTFKDSTVKITNSYLSNFISKNNGFFENLSEGKKILRIDKNGNVYISNNLVGKTEKPFEKQLNSFGLSVDCEGELDISNVYLPVGPKLYFTSELGKIYYNIKTNRKYVDVVSFNSSEDGYLKNNKRYKLMDSIIVGTSPNDSIHHWISRLRIIQPTNKYKVINNDYKIKIKNDNEFTYLKYGDDEFTYLRSGVKRDNKQTIGYRDSDYKVEKLKIYWKRHVGTLGVLSIPIGIIFLILKSK